jgi:hypothetical protein
MKTLNEKRVPYYETAEALKLDKGNPAKRQAYQDAISDLSEAFEEVLRAQADAVYEALFA